MPYALNITNFYDYDVKQVIDTIAKAKAEKQTVLPIVVNSFGGEVYGCLRMVDALKASGMKLVTILNGYAMSAGSIIFAIGEERYMSENSTIMIHEVSSWNIGKNTDIKSRQKHSEDLQVRLFNILDTQAGKEKGFFLDLVSKNNNADLFLNATQSLEYGLATQIKTPSPEEILNTQSANFIPRNPWENIRLFMKYTPDQEMQEDEKPNEIKNLSKNPNKDKTISKTKTVEVKMDLEELLAMLSNEQKEPVKALINKLSAKEKEVENISASLDAKSKELADVISNHEKEKKEIELSNDKAFLDSLKNDFKLAQANYDEELETLTSLSSNKKAKESYKKKLSQAQKVVEGAIPASENKEPEKVDIGKKIVAYANKHNLNLATDYQKCKDAVERGEI